MALHAQAPPAPSADPAAQWRRLAGALVLLCGAVSVASFFKSDPARNDFERFEDLRLLFLYFALFTGLCGVYVAIYVQPDAVPRRILVVTCGACVALLLAGFPVGSKDVFFYAFYGKIWAFYHANPYLATIADFPSDPWQALVQAQWRNKPALYGPLALEQSWLIYAITGEHLWWTVWLYKAWASATLILTLGVADALLRPAGDVGLAATRLPLLAWNPLFLFECAGSAHNEITMVCCCSQRCGAGEASMALGRCACWCCPCGTNGTASSSSRRFCSPSCSGPGSEPRFVTPRYA